jgi:hypothetical protein
MKHQSRVRRSILLEDTRNPHICGGDPSPQFVGRSRAFLSQQVTHNSHDPSATSPRKYRQQDVCDGSGVVRFFPAALNGVKVFAWPSDSALRRLSTTRPS